MLQNAVDGMMQAAGCRTKALTNPGKTLELDTLIKCMTC